jgi:diguanylate cyclase (GGDEF)-like protein
MAKEFGDARFEELEFLVKLNRVGAIYLHAMDLPPGPRRDMVASLIQSGLVNDLNISVQHVENRPFLNGVPELEVRILDHRYRSLSRVLGGQDVDLQIGHRGRVRLSELRQELQRGRIRDSFGILWDGRHLSTGLRIALLEASKATPLTVVFMDMNGLKEINDRNGHGAGDQAIKVYFHTVASILESSGEAFRNGGDEVVAILRKTDSATAVTLVKHICEALKREELRFDGGQLSGLTLSAGLATTTDPATDEAEIRKRADDAMYRSKNAARGKTPRPSSIAVEGSEDVVMASST